MTETTGPAIFAPNNQRISPNKQAALLDFANIHGSEIVLTKIWLSQDNGKKSKPQRGFHVKIERTENVVML